MRCPSTVVAAAFLAACGGADTTQPENVRGLRVIAGANVSDTAGAQLTQAIIVEVRDSTGAIVPVGTVVRFLSVLRGSSYEALVQSLSGANFATLATGNTDAAGRASVIVKLGAIAGPARIVITVPILGIVDTARYTITPGRAAKVVISPADTMLFPSRSFTFRGGVTDQYGNIRTDPVTWTVVGTGATVSSAGAFASTTTGRYIVIGSANTGVDTSTVTVIPVMRFATTQPNSEFRPAIGILNGDGSGGRALAVVSDGGVGVNQQWMPDRSAIIYSTAVGNLQQLYVTDTNGVSRAFFPNGLPFVTHQADPRPTQNGQYLFFAAHDSRCAPGLYCLYRSRIDGSGAELIGSSATAGGNLRPAPSPDGLRVAFTAGPLGTRILRVLDVETRAVSTWSMNGSSPAWSPDGTQIAYYNAGSVMVVSANGSTTRTVSATAGRSYADVQMGWTSDGKYILARVANQGIYDLIDVQTGAYLPLQYPGAQIYTLSP